MAVDVVVPRSEASSLPLGLGRLAAIPARLALAGIVALSFGVRSLLAWAHATPLYFPDEYIYSTLARSLATSGRPLIRDAPAHFPALLEPILAAPFWLLGDPMLAYRLTQMENALAMSLAAIPVFLLSRRLGLGQGFALGAAALAVASPDLVYASSVLADPIAYPLVLAAVYAGVRALDRPTRRAQLAFVALGGLAAFARIQYVLLPAAFLAAALIVERGRAGRVARSLRLSLALFATPLLALAALGPTRLLGYYADVTDFELHPAASLRWVAADAMFLAYAAGWVLVPGALVGLAYALARPRSRAESAFAALTVTLAGGLLAEAALYASNGSGRFQERYLFCLLPLVAPAFGLYARRGGPKRLAVCLLALGLVIVAVRIPLSGYTVGDDKQDSPFLSAVFRLESLLGPVDGALAVALVAALLSLVAVAITFRPARGATLGLALALVVTSAASAGAASFDLDKASKARARYLPADLRWIDHAGLGRVAVLQTPGAPREAALEQMFWNRSVAEVLLLGGAEPIDVFGSSRVRIAADGRLLADRRVVRGPLLVPNYAVNAELSGATRVASGPALELWQPDGTPRLSLLVGGRYLDGWLARSGWIKVWPDASGQVRGTLHLTLSLPAAAPPIPLRLTAPGIDLRVEVRPGRRHALAVPVASRGPWTLRFRASRLVVLSDGRPISVQAARPLFERVR